MNSTTVPKAEVYRKPGRRLKEEMAPLVGRYFHAHVPGKGWKGCQMFDKAHTVMLLECGIIPKEAGISILRALQQLESRGARELREELGGHIHCGEAYVAATCGEEVSGWMHCGRSSGDLGAVSVRVDARDATVDMMRRTTELRNILLQLAQEHVDTVMPGYTQLQHAEPMTFGFYVMSLAHQLERDFERYRQAYSRINASPAGCAILTATDFPLDRDRTQELLGFDSKLTNARDAVWSMDFMLELMSAFLNTSATLSRLADDLTIWHSSEFGMVEHPDAYCGTSSIMPQKKNPYGSQTIRGLHGGIVGQVMTFISQTNHQSDSCEMLTMAPLSLHRSHEMCGAAVDITQGLMQGLKINADLMRRRASMHWAQATNLANSLVRAKNMPFRNAHQIVAIFVRLATEAGQGPEQAAIDMLNQASIEFNGEPLGLDEQFLRHAIDSGQIVNSKVVLGGTAPDTVREDIRQARLLLERDSDALAVIESRLATAAAHLTEVVERLTA